MLLPRGLVSVLGLDSGHVVDVSVLFDIEDAIVIHSPHHRNQWEMIEDELRSDRCKLQCGSSHRTVVSTCKA